MGFMFGPENREFWFQLQFDRSSSITRAEAMHLQRVYRAMIPILPPQSFMKRQTAVLFAVAANYVREKRPRVSCPVHPPL
jgi:beta-galactosidase GanA